MIGTSEPKITRGTVNSEALMQQVRRSKRLIEIKTPEDADEHGSQYALFIGGVIRDKVPMLWLKWADVPNEVKTEVNNTASVSCFTNVISVCMHYYLKCRHFRFVNMRMI